MKRYGIGLRAETIDSNYWQDNYRNYFDVVTLWDVIEHVNFPLETLRDTYNVMKPDSMLFLDTPSRDSFYYKFSEMVYSISNGRFPLFLNILYSSKPYSHKQIFTQKQLRNLVESIGYKVKSVKTIHELSFPYQFYIKKIFGSSFIAELLAPVVSLFFSIVQIKNKLILVCMKPNCPP